MYSNGDYLNYNDLNSVEQKLKQIILKLQQYTEIPTFSPKIWKINDFPYIQDIDRIEKAIESLAQYLIRPEYWEQTKIWIPDGTNVPLKKSFSYRDINRWLFNMDLIDKLNFEEMTIWNGYSNIIWNENNDLDWEE